MPQRKREPEKNQERGPRHQTCTQEDFSGKRREKSPKYGEIKYEEMGYVRKIDWEGEKRGKREREGRPHPCQSRRKVPAIGSIL